MQGDLKVIEYLNKGLRSELVRLVRRRGAAATPGAAASPAPAESPLHGQAGPDSPWCRCGHPRETCVSDAVRHLWRGSGTPS